MLGFSKQETDAKFDSIVDFSELEEFLDMPVQNYSSGMRVRLGFAVASQMEPDILIIDEVLAVGDAGFRHKCINALAELMRDSAVVFVSHSMPQIQRVCSSVLHLDAGRIDYLGSPVAEGVKRYLGRFEAAGSEVRGDGSVSVTNICMRRGSTDWSTSDDFHVAQNGELDIQFDLMCRADLPPMVVQVLFWNLELIPALEILDTQEKGFPITESCKVSVQIDDLALSPGKYSLSVIVMSADLKKTFLHASNAASIVVSGGSATAAVCVKQANWHIQSNLIASND